MAVPFRGDKGPAIKEKKNIFFYNDKIKFRRLPLIGYFGHKINFMVVNPGDRGYIYWTAAVWGTLL